jgi:hypothetical protein
LSRHATAARLSTESGTLATAARLSTESGTLVNSWCHSRDDVLQHCVYLPRVLGSKGRGLQLLPHDTTARLSTESSTLAGLNSWCRSRDDMLQHLIYLPGFWEVRAGACSCCRMTHQHSSVRCHLTPGIYPSVLGSRGPGLQLYPVTQQQGSVQDQLTPAPFRPCQTCLVISWSLFSGDILQLCQVLLPAASATEHTCRHHKATVRCEGCSSSGVGLLARICEEKHFEGQSWGHGADWVMRPERMCRPTVGGNVQNTLVTILALHTTKTACTTLSTPPAGQLDGASWFVWAGSNTSMA